MNVPISQLIWPQNGNTFDTFWPRTSILSKFRKNVVSLNRELQKLVENRRKATVYYSFTRSSYHFTLLCHDLISKA